MTAKPTTDPLLFQSTALITIDAANKLQGHIPGEYSAILQA